MLYIIILILLLLVSVRVYRLHKERQKEWLFFSTANLRHFRVSDSQVTTHNFLVSSGRFLAPHEVLPGYFKWKEKTLVPVRDQGKCASCWAFAVADCVADRVSILTGGKFRESLSVQELLSCINRHVFHCTKGGIPELAYSYVVAHGLSTEKDYPYEQLCKREILECKYKVPFWKYISVDEGRTEAHPTKIFGTEGSAKNLCLDLTLMKPGTSAFKKAVAKNVQNMKSEIYLHGPIVGTMYVHKDFYQYDGKSVYEHKKGSPLLGGHAIEIFGWCDEGKNTKEKGFGTAYWICRNSWGVKWPKHLPYGLMYVRMGTNESGIESRASSVIPLLNSRMQHLSKTVNRGTLSYEKYEDYVADPQKINFLRTDTHTEQFL